MKKIFYGFLALAGLAMVSCSQEIDEQINANTDSVKKIFTANTEDGASTRTSIALEEETGNYVVIWNGEEKIAVNGVDYKVIEGAGTKSVTFGAAVEGTEAATAEVYNAVYPNNAWVEGGLNLEHLKEQTALNATYGHGYAVTVATTTNKEMDLKFKNALSFLRVRFSLAEDAKEEAITIKTVKITANDNLWGTVSEVNYATGEIGAVANDSELGKSIVYTAGEDVLLDRGENAIFDAVITLPVNTEGRTLTIEITGENAWTGTPYTYKAEGVTKKYLRNNVTTLAKAIKPVEVLLVADGVYKTAEDTFQIFNANGMKWFANEVNVNKNTFNGKTVALTEDVTLTEAWEPVGQTGATQFQGTFNGQDKTIKGLTINAPESYSGNYATGMFGWVETGAVIKNVKLDGATINGYHYVGAIAGYVSGSAKIQGCEVINSAIVADPTKKDTTNEYNGDKVGGIVGFTNSNNVINGNKVSATTIKGYRHMGGIVGYLYGTAENNFVDESVVITVDNTNPYKTSYVVRGDYGVNSIAGVMSGTSTNNTGEATIEWGEIPAEIPVVATVDGVEYTELSAALEAAASSSSKTVNVAAGEYEISGDIAEGLTIVGAMDGENYLTTIQMPDVLNAENVTIKDMKITQPIVGEHDVDKKVSAIRLNGCGTFENCYIEGYNAFYMGYSAYSMTGDVYFKDCVLKATWAYCISTGGTGNMTIEGCDLYGWNSFSKTGKVTIKNSNIYSNGTYCQLRFYDAAEVTDSTLADDVNIDFKNYPNTTSIDGKEITFTGNIFNGNLIDAVNTSSFESASPIFTIDGVQYVGTDAQFEAALAQDVKDINVALVADLNFAGSHSKAMGGASTESVTINGNNHKLYMTSTYMPAFRLQNGGGKVAISNMTIDGAMTSATTWDVYDILFYNNTEINNVTFQKAIALDGLNNGTTFDLTDVTINETNGDFYAMWICANGAKVTIDGLDIATDVAASKGRAIAIKDQYVDTVEKVTLKINDATFASAKKAAILVTSAEGADITASNLDITGVVADSEHAVWVDSDYAANYDAVTVSGCTKWLEGAVCDINGRGYLTLAAALAAAQNGDVVNLYPGTYNFGDVAIAPANVTIKGTDKAGVVINMNKSIYLQDKTVNFENLTYTAPAGLGYTEQAFAFVHHAVGFNFDNCVINRLRLNVASATIKDSTFEVITNSGFDGYGLYYYGNDKSNVKVENCVFNTTGKAICVYSEHAKEYNLTVNDTKFYVAEGNTTDKAAVSIHTEYGIYGTLTMNRCEATGFIANNNGLWRELNNSTKVDTKKFTKVIDGVQIYPKAAIRINNLNGWDTLNITIKSGLTTLVNAQPMTKEGDTNIYCYEFDGKNIGTEVDYYITTDNNWYQTSTKETTLKATADSEAITLNTTYLEPGLWEQDSATFGAWFFGGDDEADTMVTAVKVKDNFFEVEIPGTTYKNVNFVRCNKDNATASWDTKWNQTGNLTLNHKCYCVNAWDNGGDSQWY